MGLNHIFKKITSPTKIGWVKLCNLLEKYHKKKNKNKLKKLRLLTIKSKDLSKTQINKILKLKKQKWNFSLKSQHEHFLKQFNNNDSNNLMFSGQKLIGYTILRHIKVKINSRTLPYLLMDAVIIDKAFRKQNLGELLMCYNNNEILKLKLPSILQCNNSHIHFYKKNYWFKKKYKKVNFKNKNNKLNLMYFS